MPVVTFLPVFIISLVIFCLIKQSLVLMMHTGFLREKILIIYLNKNRLPGWVLVVNANLREIILVVPVFWRLLKISYLVFAGIIDAR